MGSTGTDHGLSIAVDGSGNVYVAGDSYATWGTPVNSHAGGGDSFAAKLDSSGTLIWNTFMGSTGFESAHSIAVDGSGNVYVTGTGSTTWGTPVNSHAGSADCFAVKSDSSGALIWNTFMGSAGIDQGEAIAVDGSGNVYVAGYSYATWGTPDNPHTMYADSFAAKLDSSGALIWNTFMGSTGFDQGYAIAVDGSGNVYVAGWGDTTWGTPVNPYQGSVDVFLAKIRNICLLRG